MIGGKVTNPPKESTTPRIKLQQDSQQQDPLRAAFESIDKNNDGFITRAEMIKAVRSQPAVRKLLGLDAFRQGSEGHTAFERKFQAMDADDSREVSWEEFSLLLNVEPNATVRQPADADQEARHNTQASNERWFQNDITSQAPHDSSNASSARQAAIEQHPAAMELADDLHEAAEQLLADMETQHLLHELELAKTAYDHAMAETGTATSTKYKESDSVAGSVSDSVAPTTSQNQTQSQSQSLDQSFTTSQSESSVKGQRWKNSNS